MSNVEKLPVKRRETGPAVTLIGTSLPASYLEEAEPSPLMHSAAEWWKRGVLAIKVVGILAIIAFYPLLVIGSHVVKDDPVTLATDRPWASPETGVMVTLIGRELEGPGWAGDRAGWHPQARLTALPAWQEGLSTSMSEYARMMSLKSPSSAGQADPDLAAAARLMSIDPTLEQTPRLAAAAEALARYEGRLERGLASSPTGLEDTLDELALLANWADRSHEDLTERIGLRDGWPASKDDIRAFYTARARAQLAGELFRHSAMSRPDIAVSEDIQRNIDRLEGKWRRAAQLNPMFVSSQSGDARLMADHLAMMAYHMAEAGDATRELGAALISAEDARTSAANAAAGMRPRVSTAEAD
ncbi:hypothetical protein [Henriciella litoralis]|uniref:hypothetical protein n=1 Tax=Henriciella litoralis TaxID=568102 RepID=UPI0009FC63B9|nr:hypothetical protein [Henriciella litoralis]